MASVSTGIVTARRMILDASSPLDPAHKRALRCGRQSPKGRGAIHCGFYENLCFSPRFGGMNPTVWKPSRATCSITWAASAKLRADFDRIGEPREF